MFYSTSLLITFTLSLGAWWHFPLRLRVHRCRCVARVKCGTVNEHNPHFGCAMCEKKKKYFILSFVMRNFEIHPHLKTNYKEITKYRQNYWRYTNRWTDRGPAEYSRKLRWISVKRLQHKCQCFKWFWRVVHFYPQKVKDFFKMYLLNGMIISS